MEISYGWKCSFIAQHSDHHVINNETGVRGSHNWLLQQGDHPSQPYLLPAQHQDSVWGGGGRLPASNTAEGISFHCAKDIPHVARLSLLPLHRIQYFGIIFTLYAC